MLKILDKIVYIVSLIAAFGLIGAYLSPIINPNTFVFFSLLGLAYPYLLIGNFILLLYWIFRWKRRTWQIVVVIAIGYPTFRTYYGTAKTETGDASYDLSLLSYNIRYFDVYGWSNQKNTREKLFNYLNKFDGDVICLQEFLMNGNPDRRKTVIEQLHTYPYYYIEKDMAIFSRLPILHKGHLTFCPWLQQFLYLRRFQARKRYGAVVQCSPGILQAGQEGAAIYERNQLRAER